MTLTPFTTKLKTLGHISITPPSFMKFCPVVPEICRGQVHGPRKERRRKRRIIIIRNGAKTISIPKFGRLNNSYLCSLQQKTKFCQFAQCLMVQLLSSFFVGNQHSQKRWVLCSFAYLRWRRRDVCNFHMIYRYIDDIIHNCMRVIF